MTLLKTLLLTLGLGVLLTGCDSRQTTQPTHPPVAFASGEECHVCGMIIERFPGPKAQTYDNRAKTMRKFCSTQEMMLWYLQPENQPNVAEVYVHDMSESQWSNPQDTQQIDARTAYFVIGSNQTGSMGKTLATFSNQTAAEQFAQNHGGQLTRFDQITIEILGGM